MKLSNIRKKLKEIYLDVYFKLKPFEYKKGNKILLTVTDGLGDNIVREKLLRKFLEEYGNDRVIVMCVEKTKSFLEKLGLNNISAGTVDYTDGEDRRPNLLKGHSSVKSEAHESLVRG